MNLEIKHLVPYLPFELKAEMLDFKNDYVGKKHDVILGLNQWDKSGKLWSCFTVGGSKPSIENIKPILKPLSDFDAIEQMKLFIGSENWCDMYNQFFTVWFDDICNTDKLILQCPYEIMQYFLKNHYDVFGLIKEGLAVSTRNFQDTAE